MDKCTFKFPTIAHAYQVKLAVTALHAAAPMLRYHAQAWYERKQDHTYKVFDSWILLKALCSKVMIVNHTLQSQQYSTVMITCGCGRLKIATVGIYTALEILSFTGGEQFNTISM